MRISGWGLGIVLTVTFGIGFFAGYKAKEWRIRFLRNKRDRLADKLVKTQRQIEVLAAE